MYMWEREEKRREREREREREERERENEGGGVKAHTLRKWDRKMRFMRWQWRAKSHDQVRKMPHPPTWAGQSLSLSLSLSLSPFYTKYTCTSPHDTQTVNDITITSHCAYKTFTGIPKPHTYTVLCHYKKTPVNRSRYDHNKPQPRKHTNHIHHVPISQ